MVKENRTGKPSGTAVQGGGLDTRIGGSISPNFEDSPDADIAHAGLQASNAQAGIANNSGRTPESAVSTDQAGSARPNKPAP